MRQRWWSRWRCRTRPTRSRCRSSGACWAASRSPRCAPGCTAVRTWTCVAPACPYPQVRTVEQMCSAYESQAHICSRLGGKHNELMCVSSGRIHDRSASTVAPALQQLHHPVSVTPLDNGHDGSLWRLKLSFSALQQPHTFHVQACSTSKAPSTTTCAMRLQSTTRTPFVPSATHTAWHRRRARQMLLHCHTAAQLHCQQRATTQRHMNVQTWRTPPSSSCGCAWVLAQATCTATRCCHSMLHSPSSSWPWCLRCAAVSDLMDCEPALKGPTPHGLQGCCEHLLAFSDVRLLHPDDPQQAGAYPELVYQVPSVLCFRPG
jgi:snRNA-activating protein complex (SNAPc), subunit 3